MFPTKETIEMLRSEYPDGTRVRLVKMDDVQAPPIGTEGTVVGVDGIGSPYHALGQRFQSACRVRRG